MLRTHLGASHISEKLFSLWFMFDQAMESAGKKFVGEHDFRNFCKMDAVNVHNYRRNITSFEIFPSDVRLTLVEKFPTHFLFNEIS